MAFNTPVLPIVTNKNIESSYVKLDYGDVFVTNYESSRLLSITGDPSITATSSSVSAFTATTANSFSAYYTITKLLLTNRNFYNSTTSVPDTGLGIFALKKRLFDTNIVKGTLTAIVSGDPSSLNIGNYYDSGSGELIQKRTGNTVGAVLYDDGMFVVTGSTLTGIIMTVTSLQYKATVQHTTLNVFCKCNPNQLNYTLNPTSFDYNVLGDYNKEPFTASTSASTYKSEFTVSGLNFSPYITKIGVYDDDNNLLAVASLAKAIKKPTDIPISFWLKIDI